MVTEAKEITAKDINAPLGMIEKRLEGMSPEEADRAILELAERFGLTREVGEFAPRTFPDLDEKGNPIIYNDYSMRIRSLEARLEEAEKAAYASVNMDQQARQLESMARTQDELDIVRDAQYIEPELRKFASRRNQSERIHGRGMIPTVRLSYFVTTTDDPIMIARLIHRSRDIGGGNAPIMEIPVDHIAVVYSDDGSLENFHHRDTVIRIIEQSNGRLRLPRYRG